MPGVYHRTISKPLVVIYFLFEFLLQYSFSKILSNDLIKIKQTQKGCKNISEEKKDREIVIFIKKCRSPMRYKLKVYGR